MSESDDRWARAPRGLRAQPGRVDVWRAQLTAVGDDYADLLSADERERPARWGLTRGILRALLGRYLQCDPTAVRFDTGPHGKPELAGLNVPLRFNVSHTRGIALYAVTAGCEVGVDVEREDRRVDAVRVARRVFGSQEAQRLQGLEPTARQREFLRAWVRYEAIVKCLGTGIGAHRPAYRPDLLTDPPHVTELDPGPGTVAAVAVADPHDELRLWAWS